MQPGDECWVLRRDGSWDRCVVRYIDHGADGQSTPLVGVEPVAPVGDMDHWRPSDLEAMATLYAAIQAKLDAARNVVEAAKHQAALSSVTASNRDEESCTDEAWNERLSRAERVDYEVRLLLKAERAEAEARARLEALQ